MFNKKFIVLVVLTLAILLAACGKASQPANPTLSFEKNNCRYSGPNSVPNGEFTLDLVQSKTNPLLFGYALVTLQNGKTIKDLQAWPSSDPPDWLTVWSTQGYLTMNQSVNINLTYHMAYKPSESLYLVCFQQNAKGDINKIGAFGPITVQE